MQNRKIRISWCRTKHDIGSSGNANRGDHLEIENETEICGLRENRRKPVVSDASAAADETRTELLNRSTIKTCWTHDHGVRIEWPVRFLVLYIRVSHPPPPPPPLAFTHYLSEIVQWKQYHNNNRNNRNKYNNNINDNTNNNYYCCLQLCTFDYVMDRSMGSEIVLKDTGDRR